MTVYRVLNLTNGDTIFGEAIGVPNESGMVDIQIKTPFCAKTGGIMPYMVDIMSNAPAAVQVNPMNIVWSAPLEDFPEVEQTYKDATSKIIQRDSKIII